MKRDAWLDKARATSKGVHPTLKETLHGNGFTFCADGCRAHLWHCQDNVNAESAKLAETIETFLQARPVLTFEVTTLALVAACNMALALKQSPSDKQDLYLSPNGSLKFRSERYNVGDVSGEFVNGDTWRKWKRDPKYKQIPLTRDASIPLYYYHRGKDRTFAVNPKYLKDALSIFDEADTVSVSLQGRAVVIEPVRKYDEWPQAIVMTINTRG